MSSDDDFSSTERADGREPSPVSVENDFVATSVSAARDVQCSTLGQRALRSAAGDGRQPLASQQGNLGLDTPRESVHQASCPVGRLHLPGVAGNLQASGVAPFPVAVPAAGGPWGWGFNPYMPMPPWYQSWDPPQHTFTPSGVASSVLGTTQLVRPRACCGGPV
jgi:hypothetical protein